MLLRPIQFPLHQYQNQTNQNLKLYNYVHNYLVLALRKRLYKDRPPGIHDKTGKKIENTIFKNLLIVLILTSWTEKNSKISFLDLP